MVAVPDAEEVGLVGSLSRPGGNITGLTLSYASLLNEQVALVRNVLPAASTIGLLQNPENPDHGRLLKHARTAVTALRMTEETFSIAGARDIRRAFEVIAARQPEALLVLDDPLLYRGEVMFEALQLRLPVVGLDRQIPRGGGLMSYGPNRVGMYGQSAAFIDRILRGTPPAQLPVEEPRKMELVLNGTTARALGLTIPPSLLLRADKIIE